MRFSTPFLFFLLSLFSLLNQSVYAQNEFLADTTDLHIRRIRFAGNKTFSDVALQRIVRTRTNREFLDIQGFTPWYFFHKRNPKWGEPPSLLVRGVLDTDIERLTAFYRSEGFFEVQIDTAVFEFRKRKIEVNFFINEGPASYVERISYVGIPPFENVDEEKRFYQGTTFPNIRVLNDTTFALRTRFTNTKITQEQNRLLNWLKNKGYASVSRDSVIAFVRPIPDSPSGLEVRFEVKPGEIYSFGTVYVEITNPSGQNVFPIVDTVAAVRGQPEQIVVRRADGTGLKLDPIKDQMLIVPGQRYDHLLYQRTVQRFQRLPILRLRRFNLSEDGSLPTFDSTAVPVYISAQTIPRYQLGFDVFGMQRIGFGAGAGLRLTNNNLFGLAHRLQFGLNGNFEYVSSENELLRAIEGTIDYTVPKLTFPLVSFNRSRNILSSETNFRLSAASINQINFDVNANVRFNWQFNIGHTNRYSSTIDLIELEWLDANASGNFRNELNQLIEQGRIDSLQRDFILNDFNPQTNSAVRYTFRDITTNLVKRNSGVFREYSLEFAGNMPYFADRFLVTPGTVEGELPSVVQDGASLDYSQFLKFSLDRRRYVPLQRKSVFATRFYGGLAIPYGVNKFLPLTRRFFAGGTNDIRGWFPLRLGPGSLQDQAAINGGEIKLLGSVEYRTIFLEDVLAANWIFSLFSDAGNIWQLPSTAQLPEAEFRFNEFAKQIAVGAGYGLRLDWDFVIFRLELAYRIHDLEQGWLERTRILRDARLQFGIGHAF